MAIGSLGTVVFEASTKKIRTFENLQRTRTAWWESHKIIGMKPKREFIAPGEDQITFSIKLDSSLGVNPSNELYVLQYMCDNGVVSPFILNGKPVSDNLWGIESMTESWTRIDNHGVLLAVGVDLTLIEYVEPPKK